MLSQLSGCAETCQTQCWAFGMCPRAQFSANRTCGVYIAVFETMKHLIYAMFLLWGCQECGCHHYVVLLTCEINSTQRLQSVMRWKSWLRGLWLGTWNRALDGCSLYSKWIFVHGRIASAMPLSERLPSWKPAAFWIRHHSHKWHPANLTWKEVGSVVWRSRML